MAGRLRARGAFGNAEQLLLLFNPYGGSSNGRTAGFGPANGSSNLSPPVESLDKLKIAAIPVRNKIEWTAPLVEHLLLHDEVDEVWVYDNGSTDITRKWIENRRQIDRRLIVRGMSGVPLYHMWNDMIKRASEFDNCSLAILNNDIRLPPYAIRDTTTLMRQDGYQIAAVDPARTGLYTYSIGLWAPDRALPKPIEPYCEPQGLGFRIGWAFVLAAEFWKEQEYAIHPDFCHYFGDDDLYRRAIERGGAVCVVRGIGCDHAESITGGVDVDIWNKDEKLYREIWNGALGTT